MNSILKLPKSIPIYLAYLGIWGWLVAALNAFTAFQLYSYVTNNPTNVITIMPVWGWLTLLILGLVLAPFLAFHKIRIKLTEFEDTQPNIIFDQIRESPLYDKKTGEPRYHIIQIWFKNKPVQPQEKSVAKQVTANIEFWNETGTENLFRILGQWVVKSHAPDFIGFDEISHKIDILPNDEYYKLIIALKWEEDANAYGFALESFVHSQTQDGRDDGRKLTRGNHLVRIQLKGIGATKGFTFTLTNPGGGQSLTMVEKK